jgi:integrase
MRVARLDPPMVRAVIGRWRTAGVSDAGVSGRFRTLAAALGWANEQRVVDGNPLDGMRDPPQPTPRMHAPVNDVIALIRHAEQRVEKALVDDNGGSGAAHRLHRAEQVLLLTRLAVGTGARRGELAALKFTDLAGRVLTIARAASMEQIGPTKTRQTRRITLGTTTATLWRSLVDDWTARLPDGGSLGEWLFSPDPDHRRRLTTSHLAHSFLTLRTQAGIPNVTLHQLRHSVATFLVDRGEILKAQQGLGHRDASTTLWNDARAMPLEDADVADALDVLLSTSRGGD